MRFLCFHILKKHSYASNIMH